MSIIELCARLFLASVFVLSAWRKRGEDWPKDLAAYLPVAMRKSPLVATQKYPPLD